MNATCIIIKPDGVRRSLVGECLKRFEQKGFIIRAMHLIEAPKSRARIHYEEHRGKEFFERMVDSLCSGPIVILWLELPADQEVVFPAWEVARNMVGDTRGTQGGTIRGDFSYGIPFNIVHASDSAESAERELNLWFNRELRDQVPHTERTVTSDG